MRGKDVVHALQKEKTRITPAHAGKREVARCAFGTSADHPRTCGEKKYLLKMVTKFVGSPPHMRGKDRL